MDFIAGAPWKNETGRFGRAPPSTEPAGEKLETDAGGNEDPIG
jgi:hypothetical protein